MKNQNVNSNLQNLIDYSPSDSKWDSHKNVADSVGDIYSYIAEFERYASRMACCSGLLLFGQSINKETGEMCLRLREAHFCRVRHCPICQWRRALMWRARFYQCLPNILANNPSSGWIFLTLTVRNCSVEKLGETLNLMNAAFQRLKVRKELRLVHGWIRTTEITHQRKNGLAHPHFHVLMMVPPSMLSGRNYIKHDRWIELWRASLRADYAPSVNIRKVKSKKEKNDGNSLLSGTELMRDAITETLKYSVKPKDMVADPAWFLELTRQTHKRRFVESGGVLKGVINIKQETDQDLVKGESSAEEGEDDISRLAFGWKPEVKKYRRIAGKDVD